MTKKIEHQTLAREREAFEAHLRSRVQEAGGSPDPQVYATHLLQRDGNGYYKTDWVESNWEGWSARAAAVATSQADPAPAKPFVGYTDKTPLQVIDEYLHPRVPADLQPVGHFVYEGSAYVATSSDDPRGVKLYGSPSEAQAVRDAHRKNRPDPCTACGGSALMGGSECPVCDGTGRGPR